MKQMYTPFWASFTAPESLSFVFTAFISYEGQMKITYFLKDFLLETFLIYVQTMNF